jgi:hypothetical protein
MAAVYFLLTCVGLLKRDGHPAPLSIFRAFLGRYNLFSTHVISSTEHSQHTNLYEDIHFRFRLLSNIFLTALPVASEPFISLY